MWKNIIHLDRQQITIWRMRIVCWITKATHTHTHGILILFSFAVRQWLHDLASLLCYNLCVSSNTEFLILDFRRVLNVVNFL